jgi:type III restriction enzyme
MIILKDYQQRVLDSLRDFLRLCAANRNPSPAFQRVLEKNGGQILPYIPVAASGLEPDMPYVCLRVPTGGGKTLLACHASGLAIIELLQAERAVVL